MDEHGFVLDVPLLWHRNTGAAKTFLTRLPEEYNVSAALQTDRLRRYGVAIRRIVSLADVDHQQVLSAALSLP